MKTISRAVYVFFVMIAMVACEKSETKAPAINIDERMQYEGSWKCTETTPGNITYTVTITSDKANAAYIRISNFNNLGSAFNASVFVSGKNLMLNKQVISGDDYEGSGQLADEKISLTYKVTDANNVSHSISNVLVK